MPRLCWPALGLLLGMAACTVPPPTAAVPRFGADDPRVSTAGFVGDTLRLQRERDGTPYTLMAFVVGDTATLGAMVGGAFSGNVRWELGERTLTMPFDTTGKLRDVPVQADGAASPRMAQGARFRGTTWLNVDVPAAWLDNGTPLRLVFEPASGSRLPLPAEGRYRVELVDAGGEHG